MNCEWREKTGLYMDGELEAPAQQAFAGHLENCTECSSAVLEQQELKKAVRIAGKRFSAPPELYAVAHRQSSAKPSGHSWWRWVMAPLAVLLLAVVTYVAMPARRVDPMLSGLVDQHITTLASSNPVDIVNGSHHVVKPWFQGSLPFTFNMPEVAGTDFQLIGGKKVFVNQRPGAQLLYLAGQHKISIFIFQTLHTGTGSPSWNHDFSFSVSSWSADGREYYLVTDGNPTEAGKLVTMFQEANRS
jgi:anti-sigma factor RsiW